MWRHLFELMFLYWGGRCHDVVLLNHMGVLFFLRNFHIAFVGFQPDDFPMNSGLSFFFHHILINTSYFLTFWYNTILVGVRLYLMVLICICLKRDNEHFFICPLTILMSLLGVCFLPHITFLIKLCILLLSTLISLKKFYISILSDVSWAHIFSY